MLRLGLPLALAALAALAVPVHAQAGDPIAVAATPPAAPIKPAIESPALPVVVTLSCQAVLTHGSISATTQNASVAVEVTFATQGGVIITGPHDLLVPADGCLRGAATVAHTQPYQVSIPRTAPGLTPLAATVTARLPAGNTPAQPEASASQDFTVTADYYSNNQVKLEQKLKSCSDCSHLPFDFAITNFGNAATTYTFSWTTGPGNGWQADLPAPLTVESGQTATATLVVTASGHGERAFGVVVSPAASADLAKTGNPMHANLLVRDSSIASRATPGLPPAPLALALLALALACARRRA